LKAEDPINMIREQAPSVLGSAKETVQTVQGASTFVSDSPVAPLIGLAGLGSAIKGKPCVPGLAASSALRRN
jgi:hypothetical protein